MGIHGTPVPALPAGAELVERAGDWRARQAFLIDDPATLLQPNTDKWDSGLFLNLVRKSEVKMPHSTRIYLVLPDVAYEDCREQLTRALRRSSHGLIDYGVVHFGNETFDGKTILWPQFERLSTLEAAIRKADVTVFSKDFFEACAVANLDAWACLYILMGALGEQPSGSSDIRAVLAAGTWQHEQAALYDLLTIVTRNEKGDPAYERFAVYHVKQTPVTAAL
jgi:hypothetical protein